jgi:hypothetical protein
MEKGDIVRIIEISDEDKDPNIPDDPELRTHELFRFCLGRTFKIHGFDEYGNAELRVDEDPEVRKRFGRHHKVWMEPKEIEFVRKQGSRKTTHKK